MPKFKLEYIWLDGKKPIPELRGKTNIKEFDKAPTLADLPLWGFDGSSTMQAAGNKSDCVLKPVALYPDASRKDAFIVLSEVMLPDGTPHPTNMRATAVSYTHLSLRSSRPSVAPSGQRRSPAACGPRRGVLWPAPAKRLDTCCLLYTSRCV